jgi:CRISPR/Cas system-associated protein Cas7 (RAMP superfamily)
MIVALPALLVLSARANGQNQSPASPHMLVVKLVEKGGAMPYAFEPAITVAQRGDSGARQIATRNGSYSSSCDS